MWYCSKIPISGYFVNIDGGLSSCASAGDTSIPDVTEARELCTNNDCNRYVTLADDGTLLCVK